MRIRLRRGAMAPSLSGPRSCLRCKTATIMSAVSLILLLSMRGNSDPASMIDRDFVARFEEQESRDMLARIHHNSMLRGTEAQIREGDRLSAGLGVANGGSQGRSDNADAHQSNSAIDDDDDEDFVDDGANDADVDNEAKQGGDQMASKDIDQRQHRSNEDGTTNDKAKYEGTHSQLKKAYNCKSRNAPPRPITSDATFRMLRRTYLSIMPNATMPIEGSGFHVPIEAKHHAEMGRGVFARTDIANGTLIWTDEYTAKFTQGHQFRTFLRRVPRDVACDLLMWSYPIRDGMVCSDLDAASLTNAADDDEDVNMVEREGYDAGVLLNGTFASRDIAAGEQLLLDYGSFVYLEAWGMLGL